jgi:hypothetical protein
VAKWAKRLRQAGLTHIFGIIDHDEVATAAEGVFTLQRYSIENYLLDPVNVYAALMDGEKAPALPGISLPFGHECKLLDLTSEQVQQIADEIHKTVESHFEGLTLEQRSPQTVVLQSGKIVMYPKWLMERRGKDLLRAYQQAFGPKTINLKHLMRAYRKLHIMPRELNELLAMVRTT